MAGLLRQQRHQSRPATPWMYSTPHCLKHLTYMQACSMHTRLCTRTLLPLGWFCSATTERKAAIALVFLPCHPRHHCTAVKKLVGWGCLSCRRASRMRPPLLLRLLDAAAPLPLTSSRPLLASPRFGRLPRPLLLERQRHQPHCCPGSHLEALLERP